MALIRGGMGVSMPVLCYFAMVALVCFLAVFLSRRSFVSLLWYDVVAVSSNRRVQHGGRRFLLGVVLLSKRRPMGQEVRIC